MTANELSINKFLQTHNVQFVIPVYQRNYHWTVDECTQLLNNIISVERKKRDTHFIGSIVYIQEGTFTKSEVKELVIIDGQQRLTTITILYLALYRFAKEKGKEQEAEMLYNIFLTNQFVQEPSNKLKLKLTDNNSIAFKAILNQTEDEFDQFSNVIENYNYFRSRINANNFLTILNGIKRLIFVEISLERGKDDPQRIFENLNSTGLWLSQSDLIRNFILMDLDPKEQNRTFEKVWNPIEKNARDLGKQKSMVSDYIRDYLTLKNKKISNKENVYSDFKKLYTDKGDESYHQELKKITSLSAHYKKLINPKTVIDIKLRVELENIARLEINVAFPFLLQVFEDEYNRIIDNITVIKILKLIQTYVWRRFIVGLSTNALENIFMTLYSEIDTAAYYDSLAIALRKKKGTAKFPTDKEVLASLKDKDLYNVKAKYRNYMFELLEKSNNPYFVSFSKENASIEHVFPENPDEEWNMDLSSSDFFAFKEKYLNTIANLTLSGNNGSLSSRAFSKKQWMNANQEKQGYQYSNLWINKYLKTINSWNLTNYNRRFDLIAARFLNIWEYPEVEVPVMQEVEEVNLFVAEKPTYRKLEYFIFENTKIEVNIIAEMYFYVIEKLYQKNTAFLLSQKNIIKITRNKNDFRTPQELINGYYLEANIDSNTKFNILKKLLMTFGLEDELTIKYATETNKNKEIRPFLIRSNFWNQLLPQIKDTTLFEKVNSTNEHWLSVDAGIRGISFTLVITKSYVRIAFTISNSSKELNKQYFNQIIKNKIQIEQRFGAKLIWEELLHKKMCSVKIELDNVSVYEEKDWDAMNAFIITNLPKFENAFKPEITKLTNIKSVSNRKSTTPLTSNLWASDQVIFFPGINNPGKSRTAT